MSQWIEAELATVCLIDNRLEERCKLVLEQLSRDPTASINSACTGHAETMAAYRFFANPSVSAADILEPHLRATHQRMREHPTVLLIQDTTEFDLTKPGEEQMQGVGLLGQSRSRWGIYGHLMLAVTPEKVPLGVCHTQMWARNAKPLQAKEQLSPQEQRQIQRAKQIEEKESYRWIQGYQQGCALAEEVSQTQLIVIGDSESDIFELFQEANHQSCNPDTPRPNWIVRACQHRRVANSGDSSDDPDGLWQTLENAPVLGTVEIEVNQNQGSEFFTKQQSRHQPRSRRTAMVTIQAATIELKGPQRPGGFLKNQWVNAVLIRETDPPNGEEPIEWMLLTDMPVDTLEAALLVAKYYRCRWQIEVYFRTLKTGCRVESRDFEYRDRFESCLAIYMIIAWRIMYVTMHSRIAAEQPANRIFTEIEWKTVLTVVTGKPAPQTPPPLATTIIQIAQLGGYLNRKNDPPPGPKAMWIGMRRLADFVLAVTQHQS